jgi:hypothetical protein
MSKHDLGIQDLARQAGVLIDAIKLLHRNENIATARLDDATRASTYVSVINTIELLEEMKTVLDPEYTLSLRYLDCCSVDWLTDHLNGDEEALISIGVNSGLAKLEIESALIDQLEGLSKYPLSLSQSKLSELSSGVSATALEAFNDYLLLVDNHDCDYLDNVRLWFAFTW